MHPPSKAPCPGYIRAGNPGLEDFLAACLDAGVPKELGGGHLAGLPEVTATNFESPDSNDVAGQSGASLNETRSGNPAAFPGGTARKEQYIVYTKRAPTHRA